MSSRNNLCWCGSGLKWKKCHFPEARAQAQDYMRKYGIILKNDDQIKKIRRACHLAAEILDKTCRQVDIGITTEELNQFAHHLHLEAGAIPAPLHYGFPPFPKSICTSLNDVICHGIPDQTKIKEGDILNIDISCALDGYYGDCSAMVCVGNIDEEKKRVVKVSHECLTRAVSILKPGILIQEIGNAIETYASTHGCSVVNQFVGHGIGTQFHEPPQVPHHFNHSKIPLAEGMIFTIEPMINAGVRTAVIDPIDQWTARTADGKPSAQWEYTVLITKEGHEILTPLRN